MRERLKRTQADIITINERFSIWRDQYQWFLYDFGETRLSKDGTELRKAPPPTYHPKLEQVAEVILERSILATNADKLVFLCREISEMKEIMEHTLKILTREQGQTPADTVKK